jgi:signal recognition particle subunit SRP19
LIETVKAGMNAAENSVAAGAGGPVVPPAGTAKGKRKVVRMRG